MHECEFTFKWYENLINLIQDCKYSISNYHDYMKYDKPCIMRHDVDMDINKAAEFAAHEAEFWSGEGFKGSTYFLLVSNDFYNIFSKNSLNAAYKILSLGNEIGLHFDETKYQFYEDRNLFIEYVEEEIYLLSKILGKKVNVVSMHRPSKFILESDIKFVHIVNSYSQEFFTNFKYMSDSRMTWREDVCSIVRSRKYDKLHILTHPFWYNDSIETTKDKLFQFIKHADIERYINVSNNFRDLSEFVRMEEIYDS